MKNRSFSSRVPDCLRARGLGYLLENGDKPVDSKCQPYNKISCFNDSGIESLSARVQSCRHCDSLGFPEGFPVRNRIGTEPETVEILAARKSIGIPIKRHRKYYHLAICNLAAQPYSAVHKFPHVTFLCHVN